MDPAGLNVIEIALLSTDLSSYQCNSFLIINIFELLNIHNEG